MRKLKLLYRGEEIEDLPALNEQCEGIWEFLAIQSRAGEQVVSMDYDRKSMLLYRLKYGFGLMSGTSGEEA